MKCVMRHFFGRDVSLERAITDAEAQFNEFASTRQLRSRRGGGYGIYQKAYLDDQWTYIISVIGPETEATP